MEQFLTVLWEAGRDKSRNKLVMVRCSRCNKEAIMRKSDIKRNKSCGCLKANTWHAYMVSRKHRKELRPSNSGVPFKRSILTRGLLHSASWL